MIKNKIVDQQQHLLALLITRKTKDKFIKKYVKEKKATESLNRI
ncbi:hypothetical protein [Photobacterium sp. NCIMB 13483]|nr:hypothetical protein [Photobacterium sp. NCIMB 13483]